MTIPESVRTAVLGRVARLKRADRAVVMCASIIGRAFDVGVLAAAAACCDTAARTAIDRACDLQLVVPDPIVDFRYEFRHGLTRDVIYGELLVARTRPVHRRIARALENIAPPAAALDALAYHSWAAGDARRLLRYNELAGDRATAAHAPDDARTYFEQARAATLPGSAAYARLTVKLAALAER